MTGVSEGTAPLTLTYTTTDGIPYTILVSVHVNVGIRLRPAKVFLFPDDTVTVRMTPVNSAGGPLKDKDGQDIQGVLELTDPSSPIHYLSAQAVQPDGGSARDALRLTTSGAPQEATAVSAEFTYTIDPGDPDGGKAYKDFSPVQVQILPLPAAVFTKETVTGEDGGTKEQDVCTLTFDDLALTEGADGDVLRCRIVDVRLADDPAGPDGVRGRHPGGPSGRHLGHDRRGRHAHPGGRGPDPRAGPERVGAAGGRARGPGHVPPGGPASCRGRAGRPDPPAAREGPQILNERRDAR